MLKIAKAKSQLASASVLTLLMATVATAQIGDVDKLLGDANGGRYRLATGERSGELITLPNGLADLKMQGGGYRVHFNERKVNRDAIQEWTQSFCAMLGTQSSTAFSDGNGPRRRIVDFKCG
jgi:hypothetical protein